MNGRTMVVGVCGRVNHYLMGESEGRTKNFVRKEGRFLGSKGMFELLEL